LKVAQVCEAQESNKNETMGTITLGSALFVVLAISSACMMLLALHKQDRFSSMCKDEHKIIRAGNQTRRANVLTVAALINDTSHISARTVDFLVDITCGLQAPVHIISANGKDALLRAYHDKITTCGVGDICADFTVINQDPDVIDLFPNRVDRLAHIREQQRDELKDLYFEGDDDLTGHLADNDFIIIVDLDLKEVPSVRDIEATMEDLVSEHTNLDAVCANGVLPDDNEAYDTYATILETDTWLLGLGPGSEKKGKIAAMEFEEDLAEGKLHRNKTKEVMIPVKSCFGGLAIYRAKVWFNANCHYDAKVDAKTNAHLLKYRSMHEERVCEHVVFHDCLEKHRKDFTISIDRNLITRYHAGKIKDGKARCEICDMSGFCVQTKKVTAPTDDSDEFVCEVNSDRLSPSNRLSSGIQSVGFISSCGHYFGCRQRQCMQWDTTFTNSGHNLVLVCVDFISV
jgi:hypothetical protein